MKSKFAVEKRKFQIFYDIYNIGEGNARKIEIADRYDPSSFDQVDEKLNENGAFHFHYDELEPNGKISFNITVKPKLTGVYESTRARIKYAVGVGYDDYEDIRKGYSTSLGRIKIVSVAEYNRRNSNHITEWLVFLIIIGLSTIWPLRSWLKVKAKNIELTVKRRSTWNFVFWDQLVFQQ